MTTDNSQCVSASADGSCIVWDLIKKVRLAAFMEPTLYKAMLYHPEESQLLTAGSNHKIAYWDVYDGSAIRVVEGGEESVNCLDIVKVGRARVRLVDMMKGPTLLLMTSNPMNVPVISIHRMANTLSPAVMTSWSKSGNMMMVWWLVLVKDIVDP